MSTEKVLALGQRGGLDFLCLIDQVVFDAEGGIVFPSMLTVSIYPTSEPLAAVPYRRRPRLNIGGTPNRSMRIS